MSDDELESLGPSAAVRALVILVVVLIGTATVAGSLLPVGFNQRLISVLAGIALGFAMLHTATHVLPGLRDRGTARSTTGSPAPTRTRAHADVEVTRLMMTVLVVIGSVLLVRIAAGPGSFTQRVLAFATGVGLGFSVLRVATQLPQKFSAASAPASAPAPAPAPDQTRTDSSPVPLAPPSPPQRAPAAFRPPHQSFPGSLQR